MITRAVAALVIPCLALGPAFAQPGAPPPLPGPASPPGPPAPEPAGAEPQWPWLIGPHLAAGVGFMSLGEDGFDPGFALELGLGFRFERRFGANVSAVWGFTELERTQTWWDSATDLGAATTDGYQAVTRWAGGCDKEYKIWCFMGAFVAYVVLLGGYAGAGLVYIGGPLASTGFLGLNLTGSYDLIEPGLGAGMRLELGASAMILLPQEYPEPITALGPTAGLVVTGGRLRIGARVTYMPSAIHLAGGGDRAAIVGLISVGVER